MRTTITRAEALLLSLGALLLLAATGQWLAGHTVKHLVAALAAWPLLRAVAALRPMQNAANGAAAARA